MNRTKINKSFEETKRVSSCKGFLGFRNRRKAPYFLIINNEDMDWLVKKQ